MIKNSQKVRQEHWEVEGEVVVDVRESAWIARLRSDGEQVEVRIGQEVVVSQIGHGSMKTGGQIGVTKGYTIKNKAIEINLESGE